MKGMQARVVLSRLSLASLSVSVFDYYVFHFLREGGCFFTGMKEMKGMMGASP